MPTPMKTLPAKKPKTLEEAADDRLYETQGKKKKKPNKLLPVTRGARRKHLDDAIEDAGG